MQILSVVSDAILLRKIEIKNVFFDKKSQEKSTGKIKSKYKLSGNYLKPLDIYTFFVITSCKETCNKHSTIEVKQKHWVDKRVGYLDRDKSYIDIRKIEPLTKKEIIFKIKDNKNRFKWVARLCDEKFNELKEKSSKLNFGTFISEKKKFFAEQALSEIVDIEDVNIDIIKKLGLD